MFGPLSGIFGMSSNSGAGIGAQNQANAANQQPNQHILQQHAMSAQQQAQATAQVFIPAGSGISGQQIQQGIWGSTVYPQYQYQYGYQSQIQGLTEAIIGYALYENGLPKEKHEEFIGKHHVKILECYHKDNYVSTLTNLKELVKQLKFDGDMSNLLDD